MKNTKLIEVLQRLSARERRRFEEYVHSPFFNKNKKVQQLCRLVLKTAPDYTATALKKERIYQKIYGKGTYNEYQINNLISDLLQLLYGFLAHEQYERDPLLEKELVLQALLEREIHTHVERNARRFERLQEKLAQRSYGYFEKQYTLHDKLDVFYLTQGNRGYDPHLQQKSEMLDRYYWCNKLRIACDMVSRNTVVKAAYECHFLDELVALLKDNSQALAEEPSIRVYYAALQMLQSEGAVDHYQQLKALLREHLSLFPQAELRVLYNFALNFCVKKINSGQSQFYREILDVYKVLLEQRIIFKNGYLTQWSYINIVTAGIRLKEYTWTEGFIHEYRDYLLPEQRDNVYTYNLASLHFERQQFHRALQALQGIEFTDAFYHMAAKIIQLKSYYELDETEAFLALVEATKKYLRRNQQLSDYQLRSNGNFLKLVARLYQLRQRRDYIPDTDFQKQLKMYRQSFDTLSPLSNKAWLRKVGERLEHD